MTFQAAYRHALGLGRFRLELDPVSRQILIKTGWFSAPRILHFDEVRTVECSTSNNLVKPYIQINTTDLNRPQYRIAFHTGRGADEWYNRLGAAMNLRGFR